MSEENTDKISKTAGENKPEEKIWKPDQSKMSEKEKAESAELLEYEKKLKDATEIKDQGKIEMALKEIGGKWGTSDIKNIEMTVNPFLIEPFGVQLRIEYNFSGRKNWMLFKTIDLLKDIYRHPDLKNVNSCILISKTVFIDNYGNEKLSQAAKIVLNRNIADKIKWENITLEMFENILQTEGTLWLHPGL